MSNNEIIKKLYYDPQYGFLSAGKLYKKLIDDGYDIKYKDVKNFIDKQEINQLTKQINKPKQFNSIVAYFPLDCVQIDIMIYDRFTFHNYNSILCVVDVYSRYAVCKALTNRKIENIKSKFEEIFNEIGYPKNINCDNEFNTKIINDFAKEHNIRMYYSQAYEENKNAIVERFNRSISELLQRWRQATKEYDWYRVLNDIVKNYNNSYHKTIKSTPQKVFNGEDYNKQEVFKIENKFNVGDKVRLKNEKNIFSKGDLLKTTKTIYTIVKIDGQKIYVKNDDDVILNKFYKPYQLLKVDEVEKYEKPNEEHEKEHNQIQSKRKQDKILKSLDIDLNNIVESKRERKPKKIFDL